MEISDDDVLVVAGGEEVVVRGRESNGADLIRVRSIGRDVPRTSNIEQGNRGIFMSTRKHISTRFHAHRCKSTS